MAPRTAIVIPARYGSSRFEGKALAPLCGRPLIAWVLERAQQVAGIAEVLVATDDQRIADAVRLAGGRAIMTSARHRNGTERVAEVATDLAVDLVVNLQGDEPLIDPAAIAQTIAPLGAGCEESMTTLATPLKPDGVADPNVVKVVCDQQGRALYFSRAPIPFGRDGPPATVLRHVGIYAFRRDFLLRLARLDPTPLEQAESLEQLRALEHGHAIRVVVGQVSSQAVDTVAQLAQLARRLKETP